MSVAATPIDYVAIFAAGNGTRLQPITNYIPKILVNFGNNTLLSHIIQYWRQYTRKFILVIHSKHRVIIHEYLQTLDCVADTEFLFRIVDIVDQENAFTIKHAIGTEFYGKRIVFTWCDIYPDETIPLRIFGGNQNIIFTFGNECRYIVDAGTGHIRKCGGGGGGGNIIGIFYFHNYQGLVGGDDYHDLCDLYCNTYDSFTTYELTHLVDIGDMDKLRQYLKLATQQYRYKTRFFNQITESGEENHLIKQSISTQGDAIIQNEMNWYKFHQTKYDFIPTIVSYSETAFVMEKIDAQPLYTTFWNCPRDVQIHIIENIFAKLQLLHGGGGGGPICPADIRKEIQTKIFDRLDQVLGIIRCFGNTEIQYVNGIKIYTDHRSVVNTIYDSIEHHGFASHYSPIHGDCQFSNILRNTRDDRLWFIDPRGYFGDTKLFGLKEYDYSKVAYSLSGYDRFNNDDTYYIKSIEDDRIELAIEDHFGDFESLFAPYCDVAIIKKMVVIHWFGLCQYNQNNVLKCVSCYYYALYLYTKYCGMSPS